MKVIISFKIDVETLEAAICHCLIFDIKLSKKNIIQEIKGAVFSKGNSLLKFPEYWGDDVARYSLNDNNKIDLLLNKYKNLIGKQS